jgi:hypothetical protein
MGNPTGVYGRTFGSICCHDTPYDALLKREQRYKYLHEERSIYTNSACRVLPDLVKSLRVTS